MNQRSAMAEDKWVARREGTGAKSKFDAMMDEIGDSDDEAQAKPAPIVKKRVAKKSSSSDSDADSDDDSQARVRHAADAKESVVARRFGSPTPSVAIGMDLNALRVFVMRAPPKGAPALQCYVERDKSGTNLLRPVYRLFLEDGKQFLLGAQKRVKNTTSNYLLSMDRSPTDRRSRLIVGKLRSNWSGSQYTVFNHGMKPGATAIESGVRSILGVLDFQYDKMGPGKMAITVPTVNDAGVPIVIRDRADDKKTGQLVNAEFYKDGNHILLHNKRPKYDEKARGHVLNFNGRVTMSSVKNFQLQCDGDGDDDVTLQFGRVSCQPPGPNDQCSCHKNTFTLDFKHPLSATQAFAICLAAMDGKLADSKSFETLSDLAKRTL
ncbi:tubby-like protein [Achlya hypogyna]|uniref:Tubby-like protein n=1 Tax=Achlya hypogyna TaxID=1202772 RepID=A0A1V9YU13_ACHHY|nr:tubby-like protein [Achlya hypogyna]